VGKRIGGDELLRRRGEEPEIDSSVPGGAVLAKITEADRLCSVNLPLDVPGENEVLAATAIFR